jgi:predicted peptidase
MRFIYRWLVIAAVILSACNDDETISPVVTTKPTVSDTITVVAATSPSTTDTTHASYPDSAFYRYGEFDNMPYRMMLPRKYDSTIAYPIVLFLHGIAERGTDNEKQLLWGSSLFKSDSISQRYPAFVIFPQCPESNYWFDKAPMQTLKDLIANVAANYHVDTNRIYIAGLSMGAYGTYAMVANNPDLFAGAIAISGDGDVTKTQAMAKTKWRIYAGKKDTVVPSEKSEKMANALKKSGAKVSIKIYPDADHLGSWVNAFAEPDFCAALFALRKN